MVEATSTRESETMTARVQGIYWRAYRRRESIVLSAGRATLGSAYVGKEFIITATRRGTSPLTAQSQRRKVRREGEKGAVVEAISTRGSGVRTVKVRGICRKAHQRKGSSVLSAERATRGMLTRKGNLL